MQYSTESLKELQAFNRHDVSGGFGTLECNRESIGEIEMFRLKN